MLIRGICHALSFLVTFATLVLPLCSEGLVVMYFKETGLRGFYQRGGGETRERL